MASECCARDAGSTTYKIYVLFLFVLAYILNQIDRYLLGVLARPMAQSIEYGDLACFKNSSLPADLTNISICNGTKEASCLEERSPSGIALCDWNYNGRGIAYELLVGPVFIVCYSVAAIPIGFIADITNRKNCLAVAVIFWSVMAGLTGFAQEYWQVALLRFGLGIGEAGCTPFAASLIADYFSTESRATALGVYNWGIYIGYSLSFAIGNFISSNPVLQEGWRYAWFISAAPGLVLGLVIFLTVKEPHKEALITKVHRSVAQDEDDTEIEDIDNITQDTPLLPSSDEITLKQKCVFITRTFLKPTLLLLCIGGAVRNAAGYVWGYNTQIYFEAIGESPTTIGLWFALVPLVGGSLGVLAGGLVSDKVVKKLGPYARLLVLVSSLLLASPFVAGALYFRPITAYLILIPGYIFGEVWVSVTLTIVVEVVPSALRTSVIAVYFFIIGNIGGNAPVLVPVISKAFVNIGYSETAALRAALYILYPGLYILAALIFIVTALALKRDIKREAAKSS